MIKKTITYKDLDGNDLTEDFWFHLNMAEVARMQLVTKGGFAETLMSIVESADGAEIMRVFEDILAKSYGIRGADNKQFEKSPEISHKFMQTDAYSVLFMELVTDATASGIFINGLLPEGLVEPTDRDKPTGPREVKDVAVPQLSSVPPVNSEPGLDPARQMTIEEMQAAIAKAQANNP